MYTTIQPIMEFSKPTVDMWGYQGPRELELSSKRRHIQLTVLSM